MMQGVAFAAAALVVAVRWWMLGYEALPVVGTSPERLPAVVESAPRSRTSLLVPLVAMSLLWASRGVRDREELFLEEWVGMLFVVFAGALRLGVIGGSLRRASSLPGLSLAPARADANHCERLRTSASAAVLLAEVGVCCFFAAWIVGLPSVVATAVSLRRRHRLATHRAP